MALDENQKKMAAVIGAVIIVMSLIIMRRYAGGYIGGPSWTEQPSGTWFVSPASWVSFTSNVAIGDMDSIQKFATAGGYMQFAYDPNYTSGMYVSKTNAGTTMSPGNAKFKFFTLQ